MRTLSLIAFALVLTACGGPAPSGSAAAAGGATGETRAPRTDNDAGSGPAASPPLVPATATLDRADERPRDPTREPPSADTAIANRIRLGYRIFTETPQAAARFTGNGLSCSNCHLNAGQREKGLPLVGSAAVFPEWRRRELRLFSLEDRIRGCFLRSENGTPPPYDSEELLAVAAYVAWLSEGQPMGQSPPWRGRNTIDRAALLPIDSLDAGEGERLYSLKCAVCHGPDGQGIQLENAKPGPLWGPGSWNDGAGMARIYTLAGFIRWAMPLTAPGTLTDREAQQIAAYVDSRPRPVYPDKEHDYAPGRVPVDAVYYPIYPGNPLRR